MGKSEVASRITRNSVVITARGGTRRQRGAAIAAEVRRWAPERLVRVSVHHADGDDVPPVERWESTSIRYARNGSHLVQD